MRLSRNDAGQVLYLDKYREQFSRPARALIVEDVDDAACMVSMVLRAHGIEVDRAGDGWEALEMLASRRFDVSFLDIGVPHVDGIEILKHMREAKHRNQRTPVVIMSGSTWRRDEALNEGAQAFLAKPLSIHDLDLVIQEFELKDVGVKR